MNFPLLLSLLVTVESQIMGYPYDYSSMFQGYAGYNPMTYNTLGMGLGTFGTGGFDNFYSQQQQPFNMFQAYGNGLYNFPTNGGGGGLFGGNTMSQNGGGFGFGGMQNNNMYGGRNSDTNSGTNLNNGNTMRAYGRRTQAFNNNQNHNGNYLAAPTRQNCNGFGCQGGWMKNKKV